MSERAAHWEKVYSTKGEAEVSWFQDRPEPSLELITLVGAGADTAIVDIGGGASRLVDALLQKGIRNVTVLDLSAEALKVARSRLGPAAESVRWIVGDATEWEPPEDYDIWHDRAAFHFLTEDAQRRAYLDRLSRSVRIGGHVIMGTFALDGPERCSGLPVERHSAETLAALLGDGFMLVDHRRHDHATPWGTTQAFQYSTFRRTA